MTRLTGYIKSFGDVGFIAGVNELKGMVEQANSPKGALDKLILALRIRTAYIQKVSIDNISVKVEPTAIDNKKTSKPRRRSEKELNLVLQS